MLYIIQTALQLGCVYSFVALALFLSYRILDIADEIVVISAGQIINHGPKDEILPQLLGTSSAVNMCDKFNK